MREKPNDRKRKKHSKLIGFMKYCFGFAIIGTLIAVPILMYIERFMYSLSQSSINIGSNISSSKNGTQIASTSNIQLDKDAESVQYSYNNKYYTYLKDSKIYINSLETGENVDIIEEELPICYYNLLYDKNMILYFTEKEGRSASTLTLKTYEIDTQRTGDYNDFTVYNFSCIKDLCMSPIINIIFINVETKTQYATNNIIYRIDLFNNMTQVRSGLIIDQMYMLQRKERIYYEDSKANIHYGSYSYLDIFDEDVTMIGIDEDENLYFIAKKNQDKVYVVNSNKIIDTIELSDEDLVQTYTNYQGVYLIYPNYIMEVSGKDPYKRIGKLSKYVTFEAVKGNIMYLRTSENKLIKTELLEN